MRIRLYQRLEWKLFAVFFLSIVPLCLLIVVLNYQIRQDAFVSATAMVSKSVLEVAVEQERVMAEIREILRFVAKDKDLLEFNLRELSKLLLEVKNRKSYISNFFFCNPQGDIVAAAVDSPTMLNSSFRKYFVDAVNSRELSFGEYTVGRVTGNQVFHFSLPVYSESNELLGVLVLSLNLGYYQKIFDAVAMPAGAYLEVTDHRGLRLLSLARPGAAPLGEPLPQSVWYHIWSSDDFGCFVEDSPAGREILAYRHLNTDGKRPHYQYLLVGMPVKAAMVQADSRFYFSIGLSLVTLAASVWTLYLLARGVIARRLSKLAGCIETFRVHRTCPEAVDLGADEIGVLGQGFFRMAQEIHDKDARIDEAVKALQAKNQESEALIGLLRRAEAELKHKADCDALTGLFNRRRFNELFVSEFIRAARYGTPFTLVLLDIDRFKLVNDTHGHLVGDLVLRHLAEIIRECRRGSDEAFRVGGEEFALLLPGTTAREACSLVERLRRKVMESGVEAQGVARLNYTVSLGLAEFQKDMTAEKDLFAAADQALYAAKRSGRNRFWVYGEPDAETPDAG